MNFQDLPATLANWVDRNDLTAEELDDIICLTEAEIYRRLRVKDNEVVLTYDNTAAAGSFLTIPWDCREIRRITWDGRPLYYVSDTEMAKRLYTECDTVPVYYTTIENDFVFSAAIENDPADWDADQTLVITYYGTESVFERHPDLYIKGGLYYTNEFLQRDAEAKKWSTRFYSALSDVVSAGKRFYYSGDRKGVKAPHMME